MAKINIIVKKTAQRKRVEKEYSKARADIRQLYSQLNKRMRTLERNNMTNSPAYKEFMKFSQNRVNGQSRSQLDISELRTELKILGRIDKNATSGYKKIVNTMKKVAENTKMVYTSEKDLIVRSKTFFSIFEKASQYLNTAKAISKHYDSERVINSINELVEIERVKLNENVEDMDTLLNKVINLYNKEERKDYVQKGDVDVSISIEPKIIKF